MAVKQVAANSAKNVDNNFVIHNIYIKDISFEAPSTPHIFSIDWNPKLDFDMGLEHTKLADDIFELLVHVTIKVDLLPSEEKLKEDPKQETKTAFLVEVKQAGIFELQNLGASKEEHFLATTAPSVLFPYIREVVSNLVTKGGFPQLVLPPMDFETMYKQHLNKK